MWSLSALSMQETGTSEGLASADIPNVVLFNYKIVVLLSARIAWSKRSLADDYKA